MTDVLPSETPIIFSNQGLRERFKQRKNLSKELSDAIFSEKNRPLQPFQFNVIKEEASHRVISVMHPSVQISVVDFYKKYSSIILSLCSRSDFSLRHPYKMATFFHEKELTNPFAGVDENGLDMTLGKYGAEPITFFAYKSYGMLYSFYDSHQFNLLEKQFPFLQKVDVSKCFENIYTHSLAWSVKSKRFAKRTKLLDGFEGRFDELMRSANDNETAGILVGPELSRIFAEIILQQIDLDVAEEADIKIGKANYAIRRYVDDYFVFSASQEISNILVDILRSKLRKYKLHLNESKQRSYRRPFVSEISIAKRNITNFFHDFFESFYLIKDRMNDELLFPNYHRYSNSKIYELKCIIKECDASYSSLSGCIFAQLAMHYEKIVNELLMYNYNKSKKYYENVNAIILITLELAFFALNMHTSESTSRYMTKIILLTIGRFKSLPPTLSTTVSRFIFKEIVAVFRSSDLSSKPISIEKMNLFLALGCFDDALELGEEELRMIFKFPTDSAKVDKEGMSYFHIVSLLMYIEDKAKYNGVRRQLSELIIEKMLDEKKPFNYSELIMLFCDSMSCPYIEHGKKIEIAKKTLVQQTGTNKNINARALKCVDESRNRLWFTLWGASGRSLQQKRLDMLELLNRKKIRFSY